jgi:hypothetical protein
LILKKTETTFELWKFAARYSLVELEEYYRSSQTVLTEIKKVLMNPSAGLDSLLGFGIPSTTLTHLTRRLVRKLDYYELNQSKETGYLLARLEECRAECEALKMQLAELGQDI